MESVNKFGKHRKESFVATDENKNKLFYCRKIGKLLDVYFGSYSTLSGTHYANYFFTYINKVGKKEVRESDTLPFESSEGYPLNGEYFIKRGILYLTVSHNLNTKNNHSIRMHRERAQYLKSNIY